MYKVQSQKSLGSTFDPILVFDIWSPALYISLEFLQNFIRVLFGCYSFFFSLYVIQNYLCRFLFLLVLIFSGFPFRDILNSNIGCVLLQFEFKYLHLFELQPTKEIVASLCEIRWWKKRSLKKHNLNGYQEPQIVWPRVNFQEMYLFTFIIMFQLPHNNTHYDSTSTFHITHYDLQAWAISQ